MNPTVYLETSIIGYLASKPSRDLITAANQQITHEWWDNHRGHYDLYASEAVVAECEAGDPRAAQERILLINEVEILNVTKQAENLAKDLIEGVPLPEIADVD